MKLGSAQIDIVSDGHLQLPVSMVLGRVPEADRDAFLKANPIEGSTLKSPLNLTLLRDGERTVLFDVGSGPNFMSSAGKIAEALDAIGVAPDAVTHVLFTHAHPDHIWGVKDDFDEEVFSNAEYHMSRSRVGLLVRPGDREQGARRAPVVCGGCQKQHGSDQGQDHAVQAGCRSACRASRRLTRPVTHRATPHTSFTTAARA
jgi:hypothetical protein